MFCHRKVVICLYTNRNPLRIQVYYRFLRIHSVLLEEVIHCSPIRTSQIHHLLWDIRLLLLNQAIRQYTHRNNSVAGEHIYGFLITKALVMCVPSSYVFAGICRQAGSCH